MSLHALAGHMASKGRGTDSMLVHMTPEEVQSLQVLALKGGGTLTINPDTGLPEANFLKKMLPMIAGAALNFYAPGVGTAVGGLFGLGAAAGTGIAVGGLSALATGSLSRGLMAGLGAYGGASLTGSLANAGTGALSSEAGNAALANAGLTGEAALSPAADEIAQRAIGERLASATPYDKLITGFKSVTDSPAAFGNFVKNNLSAGLAAISPMLADQGVQTTTKMPNTGTIRNFTFDPYGQTYTSAGNYPASEYKGLAHGGIVALAAGGTSYQDLTASSSPEQIASAYKQFTSGRGGDTQANQAEALAFLGNLGIGQDTINQAYSGFQASPTFTPFTNEQIGGYLAANPNADIAAATQQFNADPRAVNQYISQIGEGFRDPTQSAGGSGAFQYFDAFKDAGIDANELFSANKALNPNYTFGGDAGVGALQRAFGVAGQFDTYDYDSAAGNQLAKDIAFVKQYDAGGFGGDRSQQITDIARETGLSLSAIEARLDAARAAMRRTPDRPIVEGPIDEVPFVPGGVSGGGNTVVNPNNTITTAPNIPGRPEGGFTGTGQMRDAYTQGGGSTGFVNRAPTSPEDFNQRFNKQTGDSLAAYKYLMGQGANPIKSGVAQLMRPYSEAIMGIPVEKDAAGVELRPTQKFIFQDGKYVANPNYVPMSFNSKGERVVGISNAEVIKGFAALKPAETQANFDYVSYLKNNPGVQSELDFGVANFGTKDDPAAAAYNHYIRYGKGEGRPFTMLSDAKPEDKAIFEYAEANNVTDAQLASRMGIPVAEVASRREKFKDATKPTTTVEPDMSGYGARGGRVRQRYNSGGYAVGGGLGALAKGGAANLPDGAFVVPARITSELGNGSTNAGAQRLQAMEQRLLGKNAQPVNLGRYSGGGNLVRGAGDGVSDSVPATIGGRQPALIADGEYIISEKATKEVGNGSIEAGARKLYAMMDRVQKARGKTTGKNRVAANTRADKFLPA